jgi:hypothetical protein
MTFIDVPHHLPMRPNEGPTPFSFGKIGQIPSLLKSGMLISHLRKSTFVYHQVSICKPHLTWSFLCPLICTHILLNFIPVTHLFSWSHSFDSPACIVHFAKLTAEKMAFIYITWSFLPFPCHTCAFFQFVCPRRRHRQAMGMTTIIARGAGGRDDEDDNNDRAKR